MLGVGERWIAIYTAQQGESSMADPSKASTYGSHTISRQLGSVPDYVRSSASTMQSIKEFVERSKPGSASRHSDVSPLLQAMNRRVSIGRGTSANLPSSHGTATSRYEPEPSDVLAERITAVSTACDALSTQLSTYSASLSGISMSSASECIYD